MDSVFLLFVKSFHSYLFVLLQTSRVKSLSFLLDFLLLFFRQYNLLPLSTCEMNLQNLWSTIVYIFSPIYILYIFLSFRLVLSYFHLLSDLLYYNLILLLLAGISPTIS